MRHRCCGWERADYIVKHAGYLFEVPVALENAHAHAGLARERAALERRLAEMDAVYHVAHALLTAQTQEEAVGILTPPGHGSAADAGGRRVAA